MEKKEYEIVIYEAMANLSACLMMFGNGCIAQPQRMQLCFGFVLRPCGHVSG